jgi:glycosyltransferase involved in cell wall biosynthesis
MLTGENIVCFAKDWTEDPTSNNYVMRMLARHNRVLWLNSIAARTPSLSSGADRAKIVRKLRTFFDGPRQVEPNLSVFTPLVLPLPHSRVAGALNQHILRGLVWGLRQRLGMDRFQLWSFLPTAARYAGKLGESLLVYYMTDDYSQFTNVDGRGIAAMEEDLCRRADIVFATSRTLVEKKKPWNPETHLASHGVDHAHFAKVFSDEVRVATEMALLPKPIVGFFGLVQDWIDIDVMGHIAAKHPEWSVVVIGKVQVDTSRLAHLPNLHWLGRKPYESLPSYCKAWSVGLMPFVMNELTRNVNPIKMREYLSAGLPVVTSDIPEVRHYPEQCLIARDRDEFVARCEEAIASDTPEKRRARSDAMAGETWEKKVEALGDQVRRVAALRSSRK